jgi:hypothetical protein
VCSQEPEKAQKESAIKNVYEKRYLLQTGKGVTVLRKKTVNLQ